MKVTDTTVFPVQFLNLTAGMCTVSECARMSFGDVGLAVFCIMLTGSA